MKLLIATTNPGKFHEIQAIFAGSPFELIFLGDLDVSKELEETGAHYSDNAMLKAKHFHALTKLPTIGEDSGIEIDALKNELGVKTRRWGAGEKASDQEWLDHFMDRMKDEKNRTAKFIAHVAYFDASKQIMFDGSTEGTIAEAVEAPVKKGIPLSSVFRVNGQTKVYAAMNEEEKNAISHRGKAVKKMRAWLEQNMAKQPTRITFTGGGTLGHVSKNIAVIEALQQKYPDITIEYIGSGKAMEKDALEKLNIRYFDIPTGKFRRYLSWENIVDLIRFPAGIIVAKYLLIRRRPKILFSSGGYVALPVCIAAWILCIPIITHESDSVPGLANRIIGKLAKRVCLGFESAKKYFNAKKVVFTGNPVRKEIMSGMKKAGFAFTNFTPEKKIILVMGGSQGAKRINDLVSEILPELMKEYQVIHITGEGKSTGFTHENYREFTLLNATELGNAYATSNLIISRAGANAIAEILAVNKPAILIPLSTAAGNHQMINAGEACHEYHWSMLDEASLKSSELLKTIIEKISKGDVTGAGTTKAPSPSECLAQILTQNL